MFRRIQSTNEFNKCFTVRAIVFMDEQDCPYEEEFDGLDDSAMHVLGEENGEPFACGRIRFIDDSAKLERLAIRRAWRGKGLGNNLLLCMIELAKNEGYRKFKLHAQCAAEGFYRKHGFKAMGEIFMEAGIEHVLMLRED